MNYQLELYKKKQRYSVSKDDELVDENKYGQRFFLRKKEDEEYLYQPSFSQRDRISRFYLQNKKSIGTGQFRSLSSNSKDKNNSFNFMDFSSVFDEDIANSSFFMTNNKKAQTSRFFHIKNSQENIKNKNKNLSKRERILYFKLKGIELKNKIYETFDRVNNASFELNQDICNSKNYDRMFGLRDDQKYLKKDYKKINDNKIKLIQNICKCVEVKKSINPLPRTFQYLDKFGKRILMYAREMDVYKQNFLNKNTDKKNFVLNTKFYLNKLLGELNELGSDILATKKKFKGEDAIEPKNKNHFIHGLIKENELKNLSDEHYIEEIKRRKNVSNSVDNKPEKRIFALKQRSLAMRLKVRSFDYNSL